MSGKRVKELRKMFNIYHLAVYGGTFKTAKRSWNKHLRLKGHRNQ